jgi:trigger factor
LNIQTEKLDNHVARLTVEIEEKQWEQAKQKAARNLSKRYRIPGFRKGKAPYSVILRYVGEAPITQSAIESLGNELYKDVLKESDIDPYTSGSLEDFKLEPKPTYIFTVPLQPEVTLSDYRAIRLEIEMPEITDEQVDKAMREIRQAQALVEDSIQPVRAGNRVTLDIHSEFADEAPEREEGEEDDENDETPAKGDNYIHRHDAVINLDPETEPILPGFIDALVGAVVDEEREFELTIPDNAEDYENVAGRKVHFAITVKKVQSVTLPELNDDFAARVTEDEDEPLTLLQLRLRVRENMQAEANQQAETAYANRVLEKIVEEATLHFPEVMVDDRIHEMIHDLDTQLKQQGMSLESYQKVMGVTHEQLHENYHDDAVASLERTLVLGELMTAEGVTVTDEDVRREIEQTLLQFGGQAEAFRQYLDTPQQRRNIANNILYERIMQRLAKIGKGEPLDVEEQASDAEEVTAQVGDAEVVVENTVVEAAALENEIGTEKSETTTEIPQDEEVVTILDEAELESENDEETE